MKIGLEIKSKGMFITPYALGTLLLLGLRPVLAFESSYGPSEIKTSM